MRKRHENCFWFYWPCVQYEKDKVPTRKHGLCNHKKRPARYEAVHSKGKPCKFWERQRFAEESKGIEL